MYFDVWAFAFKVLVTTNLALKYHWCYWQYRSELKCQGLELNRCWEICFIPNSGFSAMRGGGTGDCSGSAYLSTGTWSMNYSPIKNMPQFYFHMSPASRFISGPLSSRLMNGFLNLSEG